jgi:tRNA (mo5U34)-methyltransferase
MSAEQLITANSWTRVDVEAKIKQLGKWFHNLDLNGVQTAPDHFLGDYPNVKWSKLQNFIPANLRGKSVLDIGCNAGFYSLQMKRLGAERVLGIDSDPDYLEQARFAAEVTGLEIEFREMSAFETPSLKEQFDLVLFMGVLYHLRYPLLALDLLAEHVVKDRFIFQSLTRGSDEVALLEDDYPFDETTVFNQPGFPLLHFIEKSYSLDPTNWWIPNRACAEAMLRSAGFEIEANADADTYICKRVNNDERHKYLAELLDSTRKL